MARPSFELPPLVHFTVEIPIRISDINYGGHLGNDAVLSIVHEARIRYLAHLGYTELDCAGAGLIMADAHIVFRSEAFHGQVLRADVSAGECAGAGFQLYTRLVNRDTEAEVARVRTGMVCFDYERKRPVPVPDAFAASLQRSARSTPASSTTHTDQHAP